MKRMIVATACALVLSAVSAADSVAWPTPTGPVKAYFDSIWEPRVVAVPLGDSGPGSIYARSDGEIRNGGVRMYGTNKVSLVMYTRDFGFNWTIRGRDDSDAYYRPCPWADYGLNFGCIDGKNETGMCWRRFVGADGKEVRTREKVPGVSTYGRLFALESRHRWIFSFFRKCPDRIGYYPCLVYSDDDGKTWSKRVEILDVLYTDTIEPPDKSHRWNVGCNEPDVVELSDGTLYMMTRTGGDHAVCYLSHDGGATWGPRFEPPAFWQSNTMPLLRRLRDGRILCVWNNTQILPRRDAAEYPELPATALSGRWESVFTNRDALHAAISEDDGQTWIGFREIALNAIRNAEDYRENGNEFWQMHGGSGIDKSVHQADLVEMPDGKVMVCYGQAVASRRIAVFDVKWLYETGREETLRSGTVNLSNHVYVKSLNGGYAGWSGHCSFNRIAGAVMAREPDTAKGTKRECLKLCRILDDRLVDDRQGVAWNFPAAQEGEVSFECRVDGEGVLVSLCDHWINPCDWAIRERAMASLPLTADTLGGAAQWKTVTVAWNLAAATVTLVCEGRTATAALKTKGFSPYGVSYLHLQTLAEANDQKGVYFRWFKMKGGVTCVPRDRGSDVVGSRVPRDRRLVIGEKASFSPDGKRLVFERLENHRHKIGMAAVGSREVRWVYDGPGDACQPAWAPDGSVVFTAGQLTNTAFVTRDDKLGYNLWQWKDGAARRLTGGRIREYAASVAPDGRIYFVSEGIKPDAGQGATGAYSGNRTGIGRIDPKTGAFERVAVMKEANAGMLDPTVSPDGTRLLRVEVANYSEPWRIVVSPIDKSDERTYLTGMDMVAHAPAWSPDGKTVAFSGCRTGDDGWTVYVMPAAGGEMRKIAKGKNPSFSPDGRTLVYDRDGSVYSMPSGL